MGGDCGCHLLHEFRLRPAPQRGCRARPPPECPAPLPRELPPFPWSPCGPPPWLFLRRCPAFFRRRTAFLLSGWHSVILRENFLAPPCAGAWFSIAALTAPTLDTWAPCGATAVGSHFFHRCRYVHFMRSGSPLDMNLSAEMFSNSSSSSLSSCRSRLSFSLMFRKSLFNMTLRA